jgi:triacylglycerol lipase
MLVILVRIGLAAELLAGFAIGSWLVRNAGWSAWQAASAVAAGILLIRLAIVGFTMVFSWLVHPPRPPGQRLGPLGTIGLVAGEWRAMLVNNFYYLPFEKLALRADPPRTRCDGVPVLLVHGYFSNRAILRVLVRSLEARGVSPVFTFNFAGHLAPIESLATQLGREIDAIVSATGCPRLALACHSMGGLVARAYVERHGAGKVAALVTIASPHNGTSLAALAVGACGHQMRRGSDFLRTLAEREGALGPGCPATSIHSVHDNLVAPYETGRLPWSRNLSVHGVGHVDILLDPRVHGMVAEELRQAGVAVPR